MLKKIITTILLVGVTGALVWGGVNRTLAKTNHVDSSTNRRLGQSHGAANSGDYETTLGVGRQEFDGRGIEECDGNLEGFDSKNDDFGPYNSRISNSVGNYQGKGYRGGNPDGENNGGYIAGSRQGSSIEPLDELELKALNLALDDEYHALSVYQSVLETFGPVEPFVEIAQSEQRHISALVNQYEKHGIDVPENTWSGKVPTFDSLPAACQSGADAEIANYDLYQELLSMTDDPGLIQVFTHLSRASQESHLPQFLDCQ